MIACLMIAVTALALALFSGALVGPEICQPATPDGGDARWPE
jgi:hypothetical protein